MEEDNINIQEIERFLAGSMEQEEHTAFVKRMSTDNILAKRVQLIKDLDVALEQPGLLDLQANTEALGADFFSAKEAPEQNAKLRTIPFYRRPLAIAAALLLLVGLGGLLWSMANNSPTNAALFANHYTVYPAANIQRDINLEEDPYAQAMQQYQAKQFDQALNSFQTILTADPGNSQLQFYLAQAALNQNPPNLNLAITNFEKVIAANRSVLVEKSIWYLALVRLKQDNTVEAKKLLSQLANAADNNLKTQSAKLLKQLK